jgi:hypothetical protein
LLLVNGAPGRGRGDFFVLPLEAAGGWWIVLVPELSRHENRTVVARKRKGVSAGQIRSRRVLN